MSKEKRTFTPEFMISFQGLLRRLLGMVNCLIGHSRVVPESKLGHSDIMGCLFKP